MLIRTYLSLLLLAALPVWSQVAPSVTGHGIDSADDSLMQTPPPVSGQAYPITVGSEIRSNYLRGALAFNSAYNDNLLAGTGAKPISDISYSIWPTISLNQTTPRIHQMLTYSPGFTFYQRTSALNEQNQSLSLDSQYRLSPHTTISVQDEFRKSSNVLNQSNPLSGVTVSGSAQSPIVPFVTPFANQLSNTASAELTYQFNRNDMIGGSGIFANLHYSDPSQVQGLYDSESRGGSAFYNHRLSAGQYGGAIYQYAEAIASPLTGQNGAQTETQTNAGLLFYTIYLKSSLSLSVMAGPQDYEISQSTQPVSHSWTPATAASMGWQASHVSFAASYSRMVSGVEGLPGAYRSNSANLSAQWQMSRTWSVGGVGSYADIANVNPAMSRLYPGGSSISGTLEIRYELNEHWNVEAGYTRLNQNYSAIAAASSIPNADREYMSVSYQFVRPMGR
jgi:hypothetical protein